MKNIIFTLLFLMMSAVVFGATTVTINSPANLTYDTDGSITLNYTVSGNASIWTCQYYKDGTSISTNSAIVNNTASYYTYTGLSDGTYLMDIYCYKTGIDTTGARSDNNTYYVDSVAPAIVPEINGANATNGQWVRSGTFSVGATVTDSNAGSCILYTTINSSANDTQAYGAYPTGSETYTTATSFNFTGYSTDELGMADDGTGKYYYSIWCNDSAGLTTQTENYTILVDATAPTAFYVLNAKTDAGLDIPNASLTTDYTPQITWNTTTENNFSRYEVWVWTNTSKNVANTTSISSLSANSSTLTADTTYIYYVTAYDLAGNSVNSTPVVNTLTTDSTGHTLYSGWNIIMNTGNGMTLTNALAYSGATIASWFNTSSNSFVSYVDGGTGGATSVPYGEAIFLYMGSAGTMDDLVVNTSAGGTNFNLTNLTASDWNIACNRNTTTTYNFSELDYYLNGNKTDILSLNVTYFSMYNSSASTGSKYIPYVANWTTATASTPVKYGECLWLFLNDAVNPNGYLEIDWLDIT